MATPRYVMLAQSTVDASLFAAYGTDGVVTFGVTGTWSTDLEPFLELIRALGGEVIRMPGYCQGDYHVESVTSGTQPEGYLPFTISPQNIVIDPPDPDPDLVVPAPGDIEASFNGLYGISVAA